ncbi:uncharacterized protein isoform X2 [Rhodnius prolixus]|uniref:uncharacterized protein isoform X2 n=1 Tax=Rhodnius prolixus TaxID=13249 RepID=UPI003D18B81B
MSKHEKDNLKKGILIKRDDTLRTNERKVKRNKEDGPSIKKNKIPRTKSEIERKIGTNDKKEPRLSIGRRDSSLSDKRVQKTNDRENKLIDAHRPEDKAARIDSNKSRRDYWEKLYKVQKAINWLKVKKKKTGDRRQCDSLQLAGGPAQPCCWCSVLLEIKEYTPEESISSDEEDRASSNENSSEVFVTADEEFTASRHENTPVGSSTSDEEDKRSRNEKTQEESITSDEERWAYRHENTPVESNTSDEEDKPSRNENYLEDSTSDEDRVKRNKNFPQEFISLGKKRHENTPVESITSDEEGKPSRNENSSEDSTSEEEDRVKRNKNYPREFISLVKKRHENTPVESITSDEEYKVKRNKNFQDDFISSDEEDTANRHENTPEESITSDEEYKPSRNKKSPEESIIPDEEDRAKSNENSIDESVEVRAKRNENSPEELIATDEKGKPKSNENVSEEIITSDEEDRANRHENTPEVTATSDRAKSHDKSTKEFITSDEEDRAKSHDKSTKEFITSDEEDRAKSHDKSTKEFITSDEEDRAKSHDKSTKEFITTDEEGKAKSDGNFPEEFITSDEDRAKSHDKSTAEFIQSDVQHKAKSDQNLPKEKVTSDKADRAKSAPPNLEKLKDDEELYKDERSRKDVLGDTNIMHTWIDNVKEALPYICENCQKSCPELHKAIATHILHGGIMPYQKNCNLQKHPFQNSGKSKLECFICCPAIVESSTPYNVIHEKAEHIRRHLVQCCQKQYVTLNYKGTLAIQQCRECKSSTPAEQSIECLSDTSEIRQNMKFYVDDSTASSSEIAVSISKFHQKRLTRKSYPHEKFVLVVAPDDSTDPGRSVQQSLTSKEDFENELPSQPLTAETEDDIYQRPTSTSTKSSLKESENESTDQALSDVKSATSKEEFEDEFPSQPVSTETEDDTYQRPIGTSSKSSLKESQNESTDEKSTTSKEDFEEEYPSQPVSSETEDDQRPISTSSKSSLKESQSELTEPLRSDEKSRTSKEDFEDEFPSQPVLAETEDDTYQRPIRTDELTDQPVSDEKSATSKENFEDEFPSQPVSTESEDDTYQRPISTTSKSSFKESENESTDQTPSDEKSATSKEDFEEESTTRPASTETEDDTYQRPTSTSTKSSLQDSKTPTFKEQQQVIKKPPPKNVFQFVEYLSHLKENGELEREKIDLKKLARWYEQGRISDIKIKKSIKDLKNKKHTSLSNEENKKIFFFARIKSETRMQFNASCSNIANCVSVKSRDRLLQVDSNSESEGCDQLKQVIDFFLDEDDVINLCAPLNAESSNEIECKLNKGLEKSYYFMLRKALLHATKQLISPAESVIMEKMAVEYGNPKVMVLRHRNTVLINLIKESNSKPLIIPKCDLKMVKCDNPCKKYPNKNTLRNKFISCMMRHFPVKFIRVLVSHLNSNKYEKKMNLKVIKKKVQKLRTQNELSLKELGILSDHFKTMQALQKVLSIKKAKDIMKPTFPKCMKRKITDKYNLRTRKINDMNKIKRNLLTNALATHKNYKGFVNHMFAIGVLNENPKWRRNFVKIPGYHTNTTVRTTSEKSLHTRKAGAVLF